MRWIASLVASAALVTMFLVPTTATADGAWLDGPVTNWNTPGMAIPQAPPRDPSLNPRCFEVTILPVAPQEQVVADAGWMLYGPAYAGLPIEFVHAMAGFDGMCRPLQFQVFLFVDGELAGTFSPVLMDSRTDGALIQALAYPDDLMQTGYARYTPQDPLCCPSGRSTARWKIDRSSGSPVVLLQSVKTEPTSAPPTPAPSPSPVPAAPSPSARPSPAPVQVPAQIPRSR
jgi:hypothetical protein